MFNFKMIGAVAVGAGALLSMMAVNNAQAAQIGVGAFGSNKVVTDFNSLGLPFINSSPLTINGNTYRSDDGNIRYSDVFGDYVGRSGDAIGNNSELGFIDVVLGTAVKRAGAYIGVDFDWSATAQFFDQTNTLLGSIDLSGGPSEGLFAGWEADSGLISRIRFTDTAVNGRILILDDLVTENPTGNPTAVPTPALLPGLIGLGAAALRKRKQEKVKAEV